MFGFLIEYLSNRKRQREWRRINPHNKTSMGAPFNTTLVSVGKATYGEINVINHSSCFKLKIGHYCSIAPGVLFIVCGDHRTDTITTFPLKVRYHKQKFEALSKGDILIGDDVWIGSRVTILSGVTIGRGAVICAGAVVSHDIPPYTIVGGVPAKPIRRRFSDSIIERLMKIDFEAIDDSVVNKNIDKFYMTVNDGSKLDWLPQIKE